ncbi:hypothetical protein PR048_013629 [Dryococelus australis]|uniref:Uncharacterized protein n=1 Tax=Dryococelus australis TaxID=614101 RepID=A0ABQ9HSQ3_9NEOP|nr:hypothetical protein PR048_013629 [Dryococelus australis]
MGMENSKICVYSPGKITRIAFVEGWFSIKGGQNDGVESLMRGTVVCLIRIVVGTSERRAVHEFDVCPWSKATPRRRERERVTRDSRVGADDELTGRPRTLIRPTPPSPQSPLKRLVGRSARLERSPISESVDAGAASGGASAEVIQELGRGHAWASRPSSPHLHYTSRRRSSCDLRLSVRLWAADCKPAHCGNPLEYTYANIWLLTDPLEGALEQSKAVHDISACHDMAETNNTNMRRVIAVVERARTKSCCAAAQQVTTILPYWSSRGKNSSFRQPSHADEHFEHRGKLDRRIGTGDNQFAMIQVAAPWSSSSKAGLRIRNSSSHYGSTLRKPNYSPPIVSRTSQRLGAAEVERLAYSPPPPPRANRVKSRTGHARFPHVRIVPDDAAFVRVFSGISRFPRPFITLLLHTDLNNPHWLSRHSCQEPPKSLYSLKKTLYFGFNGCEKQVRFPVGPVLGFSHVGIMLDDAASRRVFSRISCFPRRFSVLINFLHPHRATVAEWLARSSPTKANRLQSPAGSPDFLQWESCRTMPLVAAFSRGSPALSFRRCSTFTSVTLMGSQDLAVKSHPNPFSSLRPSHPQEFSIDLTALPAC